MRESLRAPGAGEKREMGFLEKIECNKKAVIFNLRTGTGSIRLSSTQFEGLPIRVFTPDLQGLQLGCNVKPVDFPAVFIYKDSPDAKAKTAGKLIGIDFVPKAFTLN